MRNYVDFKKYLNDMHMVTGLVGNSCWTQSALNRLEEKLGVSPYNIPDELWEAARNEEYWDCGGLTAEGAYNLFGLFGAEDIVSMAILLIATYPWQAKCELEHYIDLKLQGYTEEWLDGYSCGGGFAKYIRPDLQFVGWWYDIIINRWGWTDSRQIW